MSDSKDNMICPHCGEQIKAFDMPAELSWGKIQWACFNNDCSYYREGWDWIKENYNGKGSYRYRVTNLETGASSPLSVWSEKAMIDRIIKEKG